MRIYISGKITGRPEAEYRLQFARAAAHYRSGGFMIVNPVELSDELRKQNPDATYEDYMKKDLEELRKCTHIAMLEGWETSPGAKRERAEAEKLGLEIMQLRLF